MRYKTVKFSNLEIDDLLKEIKDGDIEVTVTEDDIDSGEATSGQVLVANGEGGAEFTDPITYESKPAASGGTDVSLVTTGEKYNWNTKQGFPEASQEEATLAQIAGVNSNGDPDVGKVAAANVNSGSATSGQVLMADGNGGAGWVDAGKKLYRHILTFGSGSNVLNIKIEIITDDNTSLVGSGNAGFNKWLIDHNYSSNTSYMGIPLITKVEVVSSKLTTTEYYGAFASLLGIVLVGERSQFTAQSGDSGITFTSGTKSTQTLPLGNCVGDDIIEL